jgi:hypothetical protein
MEQVQSFFALHGDSHKLGAGIENPLSASPKILDLRDFFSTLAAHSKGSAMPVER